MVKAVDGVTFDVPRNTIVGLVGESGSGKTTTGRALLRLFAPTAGRILFDGQDITNLSEKQMLPWRRRMQIVFQDPYASLNPRMTVSEILGEALDTHKLAQNRRAARIGELLERVGLNADHARRYPHEFSGGQRQHRHRPRAGGAGLHRGRRAGLGAGRVGPGAGAEPAAGPAARPGPDHAVRGPRPGGGGLPVRRSRGDVPGPRDGTRPHQQVYARPRHLYSRPAVGRAGAGPARAALAHPAQGRHSQPGQPAVGLRVPHPLSARDRGLRRAAAAGGQCRPGHHVACIRLGDPELAGLRPDPGPFP